MVLMLGAVYFSAIIKRFNLLLWRTLEMERRNGVVKLAAKKLSQTLNIDLLDAASQVEYKIITLRG